MTHSPLPFSATDSALGYLYQVRMALLWSLRRARTGAEFVVSLETLDDVTFESLKAGGPKADELLQTKHHRTSEASLTNASADLWKSLRVWFEGHANNVIPTDAALYLLTTGAAPKESAAWFLRSDTARDVARALEILTVVTQTSSSSANAPAYTAFLSASDVVRRSILENVVVLDRAPGVLTVDEDLRTEVRWCAPAKHLDAFLRRLEGWWLRRIVTQLAAVPKPEGVLSSEIESEMSDLREQFRSDSLPIDDDLLEFSLDDATHAAHEGYRFVHQLKLIDAGNRRVAAAIRDFYRAFEQRSRWVREDLLLVGDLSRYEKRLIEEWELAFDSKKDELGEAAAEADMCRMARSILAWAEQVTIPIRPGVTEPFVVRGSYHMLADEDPPRIGWHPEFLSRLSGILSAAAVLAPSVAARGAAK